MHRHRISHSKYKSSLADEMLHQYNDSGAKAIIILEFYNKLEALPKTKIETVIVTTIGDMLGGLKVNSKFCNPKKLKMLMETYGFLSLIYLCKT